MTTSAGLMAALEAIVWTNTNLLAERTHIFDVANSSQSMISECVDQRLILFVGKEDTFVFFSRT